MSPDPETPHSEAQRADLFGATSWTVVMAALNEAPGAQAALEQLCNTYWQPVYAYIRHRGHSPHDAEDLTQGFFLEILNNKRLRSANRTKGKFRAYLLAGVNGFLANHWHHARAAKRGGAKAMVSLDAQSEEGRLAIEAISSVSPEKLFERRWAETVLERAQEILRQELSASGKRDFFEELRGFLTDSHEKGRYAQAAARLGMTDNAFAVAVHRLRQRFRSTLRAEIARTVGASNEVEEEMRHLFSVLGAG